MVEAMLHMKKAWNKMAQDGVIPPEFNNDVGFHAVERGLGFGGAPSEWYRP